MHHHNNAKEIEAKNKVNKHCPQAFVLIVF